ncbi:alpha/beta hydrolase [Variovorax sp. J31P207]|uniref:alpha/beta fold hydrolase n=1 Tax=Variovorax sp. J31P207 TaxID=3053510 RepID=UPI002578B6AE|nr:alpha/beta hydrolase [Variovorax sp. J31P207]MDM0066737.1 alpha/beta hydrolase [Variovorax sp. J31P207]
MQHGDTSRRPTASEMRNLGFKRCLDVREPGPAVRFDSGHFSKEIHMNKFSSLARAFAAIGIIALHFSAPASAAASGAPATRPTVVLVHGAFAESASWNEVARDLRARSFPVVAAANPLRGLKSDADYVAAIVGSIPGPVVLVGHSYGGSVISAAAAGKTNVKALVFVAAFAPEVGESAVDLSGKFPGSTLGPTLAAPVVLPDGAKDLYIQQDKFGKQFADDVAPAAAQLMAVAQRPITEGALGEAAPSAAWKTIPSWFIYGDRDKNIPPAALAFMAERAKSVKTVVVKGASHVVMTSRPKLVSRMIIEAADAVEARAGRP